MAGEDLGIMTIRVVDAGRGVTTSPGGASVARMPSQATVPNAPMRVARVTGIHTPHFQGIAGVIAQSTTNPYGAAVGAASLAGATSIAGPMLVVGAAVAAAVAAVAAVKAGIENLSNRVQDVGKFAPQTLQAIVGERIASFQRRVFRAQEGDIEFSEFQRSLTSFKNTITPLVSSVERMAASGAANLLKTLTGGLQQLPGVVGAAIGALSGGAPPTGIMNELLKLQTKTLSLGQPTPNDIFQKQLDFLTLGRAFGGYGPPAPAYLTRP